MIVVFSDRQKPCLYTSFFIEAVLTDFKTNISADRNIPRTVKRSSPFSIFPWFVFNHRTMYQFSFFFLFFIIFLFERLFIFVSFLFFGKDFTLFSRIAIAIEMRSCGRIFGNFCRNLFTKDICLKLLYKKNIIF